jgi:hypothetical protein
MDPMNDCSSVPGSRQPRGWLSFSVRTLLIVTTLFGVWMGLRVNAACRQEQGVAAIRKLGGWVQYDYEHDPQTGNRIPAAKSWVPKPILDRTGPDLFHDVVHINMVYNDDGKRLDNPQVTDAVKNQLAAFPRLRELLLKDSQATDDCLAAAGKLSRLEKLYCWNAAAVTDGGTAHLRRLTRLTQIHISGSRITDETLGTFGTMWQLERLSLQENHFTDRGLSHLKNLRHLKSLWVDLGKSDISDTGLIHLEGLPALEELAVQNSRVTPAGIAKLKRATPALKTVITN